VQKEGEVHEQEQQVDEGQQEQQREQEEKLEQGKGQEQQQQEGELQTQPSVNEVIDDEQHLDYGDEDGNHGAEAEDEDMYQGLEDEGNMGLAAANDGTADAPAADGTAADDAVNGIDVGGTNGGAIEGEVLLAAKAREAVAEGQGVEDAVRGAEAEGSQQQQQGAVASAPAIRYKAPWRSSPAAPDPAVAAAGLATAATAAAVAGKQTQPAVAAAAAAGGGANGGSGGEQRAAPVAGSSNKTSSSKPAVVHPLYSDADLAESHPLSSALLSKMNDLYLPGALPQNMIGLMHRVVEQQLNLKLEYINVAQHGVRVQASRWAGTKPEAHSLGGTAAAGGAGGGGGRGAVTASTGVGGAAVVGGVTAAVPVAGGAAGGSAAAGGGATGGSAAAGGGATGGSAAAGGGATGGSAGGGTGLGGIALDQQQQQLGVVSCSFREGANRKDSKRFAAADLLEQVLKQQPDVGEEVYKKTLTKYHTRRKQIVLKIGEGGLAAAAAAAGVNSGPSTTGLNPAVQSGAAAGAKVCAPAPAAAVGTAAGGGDARAAAVLPGPSNSAQAQDQANPRAELSAVELELLGEGFKLERYPRLAQHIHNKQLAQPSGANSCTPLGLLQQYVMKATLRSEEDEKHVDDTGEDVG
jgi:hypothetical protein